VLKGCSQNKRKEIKKKSNIRRLKVVPNKRDKKKPTKQALLHPLSGGQIPNKKRGNRKLKIKDAIHNVVHTAKIIQQTKAADTGFLTNIPRGLHACYNS
jgi:hypothetical protein